jgi:FAD synthase
MWRLPHHAQLAPNWRVCRARAGLGSALYEGVANLGHRPTIEGGDPAAVLEAHLLELGRRSLRARLWRSYLDRHLRDES